MSDVALPDTMLDRIEDLGGAAQPLLKVDGLTKHFPDPRRPARQEQDRARGR